MRNSDHMEARKYQVAFSRKRDDPQFEGMRRENQSMPYRGSTLDSEPTIQNSSFSHSLSDIWERESKWSLPNTYYDHAIRLEKQETNSTPESVVVEVEENSPADNNSHLKELKRTFTEEGKNATHYKNYSPRSAATFYCGSFSPSDASVLEMCNSIERLNKYLEATKADVEAGVPGKFLQAVIGQELADVGSIISTITYAFFLHEYKTNSHHCTVPIINISRAEFNAHAELKWLLRSCRVEETHLVFIDEVDLSYHDLFGNLKLVLLNCDKLPLKQEGLKDALAEIVDSKQDCTSCAVVAEKFLETIPEILAGQGFCRLLLSGILLDTTDLQSANCTSKDKYTATLLIKGAGRFGFSGLYQILRYKMNDITDLKVQDILRRDFKKWTRVSGKPISAGSRLTVIHIGMSSIGVSIEQLLSHEDSAAREVTLFQESEKLRLLMVVSGHYDYNKNFKREILVSASTAELMASFLHFFSTNGKNLPLKALDQLDLKEEQRAFEIDNKLTSRRSIERILEEFGGVLRKL
ncbi:protein prune homolog [Ananas comosus]|uniref:Protein prune homolog n=1 Tax=Ananas comosus TaxID=4615 RepID=A0A6P5FUN4_ANACO|nr:protein prune homolog [Ananas comosus]